MAVAVPCSRDSQHTHLSLADHMLRDFLFFLPFFFFLQDSEAYGVSDQLTSS